MENYNLIRPLGSGGTASVYRGVDKKSGERYAIKKYENETVFSNAGREFEILAKLSDPAVPKFRELVCEGGVWYAVMEYIPGISMKEQIQREGRIAETDVIRWGKELCDVLSYLHSRYPPVIFRDLKPANIMLSPLSEVHLIDFGAAVEISPGIRNPEREGDIYLPVGTPGYAAPEQFGADGDIDERTDIYALGATLSHMLTGESPFYMDGTKRPVKKYPDGISPPLKKIVEKCLKEDPRERYRFCEEIKEDLKNITGRGDKKRYGTSVSFTAKRV